MTEKSKFQEEGFIARWMAEELTPGEASDFKKWIKANPHQKQYFAELKKLWKHLDNIKLKKRLSKEQRWERIAKNINTNSNGKSANR